MITDAIVDAMDAMIDLCSDETQALGMRSLREMLCDFDENNWSSINKDEQTEWLSGFLSCLPANPNQSEKDGFQVMGDCPACGAAIDPKDGEDDGYGKLHLYWKCPSCGISGAAVIDMYNNNTFIGHEIDS